MLGFSVATLVLCHALQSGVGNPHVEQSGKVTFEPYVLKTFDGKEHPAAICALREKAPLVILFPFGRRDRGGDSAIRITSQGGCAICPQPLSSLLVIPPQVVSQAG